MFNLHDTSHALRIETNQTSCSSNHWIESNLNQSSDSYGRCCHAGHMDVLQFEQIMIKMKTKVT